MSKETESEVHCKSLHVGDFPSVSSEAVTPISTSTSNDESCTSSSIGNGNGNDNDNSESNRMDNGDKNKMSDKNKMTSDKDNMDDDDTGKKTDRTSVGDDDDDEEEEEDEEMEMEEVFDETERDEEDWMTESAPARMSLNKNGVSEFTRERFQEPNEEEVVDNATAKEEKKEPESTETTAVERADNTNKPQAVPPSKEPPKKEEEDDEEEEEGIVEEEEEEVVEEEQKPNDNGPMSISERRAQRLQNRQRKMRPSPPPRRRGASPSPTPPLRSVGTAPAATVSSTNRRTAIMNMPHPDISSRSLNPQNSNRTLENHNDNKDNNSNTNTNSDQQIAQLNAQLIQHQEQTIHALQELSQTIKHLMVTQIKRDKDSEDDTKDMLNVDRATVRLDGLEVYAVVSALTVATAIACFDSYGTDLTTIFTPSQLNRHNALPLFLNTVFLAVSGIGIIAGLHATLVFSLMTMYGRTAVGVSHDEAFVEFFVQTGRVRYRGFHTFRMSLYCFLIQVLFTITSKSSPILRPFVIIVNLACIYWVYVDTQSVIDKAGDILFNFNAQQQRRTSDAGNLSLQRTLSDMSGNAGANRSPSRQHNNESSGESDLDVSTSMKHQQQKEQQPVPKASGGGASTLQNMRQRARARPSAKAAATVNGRYSRKKGVARSKSGVLVYDVGPRDARPVRRGGRRPSRNN